MHARSLGFMCLLALGCGAKTGLEIPDAPYDAGTDAAHDVGTDVFIPCEPGRFPIEPARADMLLVVDRSGSMRLDFEGRIDLPPSRWRWAFLRGAIERSLPTLGMRVRVGAKFYPAPIFDPDSITPEIACRTAPGIDVPLTLSPLAPILANFDLAQPLGGTPTAQAIVEARAALSDSTAGRRFIVLATDGGPNCNAALRADPRTCICTSPREDCLTPGVGVLACVDDPRTLTTLEETNLGIGVPVFVVGIEDQSRPDLLDYLERMAIAGGRPRRIPGERAYYSVRSGADLDEAFSQITASISRCAFVSPSIPGPGDEASFSVEVGGTRIREDAVDGWTWTNRTRGELELHGAACERAGGGVVAVVDRCGE